MKIVISELCLRTLIAEGDKCKNKRNYLETLLYREKIQPQQKSKLLTGLKQVPSNRDHYSKYVRNPMIKINKSKKRQIM